MTQPQKVFSGAFLAALAFAVVAHAGQHQSTRVTAVGTGITSTGSSPANRDVAVLLLANSLLGTPCSTSNRVAIDLTTNRGRQAANLATAALMSKVVVAVVGNGTCVTVSLAGTNVSIEMLDQISVAAP